ncbi:bifunctional phosphoribosylaminoimidazolecarboxamide formyltransferase/inosine monophosphate cyclohydrolase, partial [Euryarchaeota archaeon ex4484_178]
MRALISVSDKSKLDEFAKELISLNYEILATGGTYRFLREHGISALKVEDVTGYGEMLGGRVKTLHPKIHGAILARNTEDLKEYKIMPIDMVVVNLYPFEKYRDADEDTMIENIDIGGVALLRAAAKNYERVIVVSSPEQYEEVISLLRENGMNKEKRRELALEAFAKTAAYDIMIYNALWKKFRNDMPEHFLYHGKKAMDLRYGENPHQRGAYYS